MDKKQLRQLVISKRNTLTEAERTSKSALITHSVLSLPEVKFAKAIAGFMDFRGEVYMTDLLNAIISNKTALYLPRIIPNSQRMEFYQVSDLNHLKRNAFGILEPNPRISRLGDINHLSVVLTPGVAFSKEGYRLGYGAGYYDRFFKLLSEDVQRIGIGFDLQLVDNLPIESHDVQLHRIITESQHIECIK